MPIMNPPKSFPGLEKLPPLVRTMIERIFPQDPDMPIPAMGGIMAASVPNPAAKALGGVREPYTKEVWSKLEQVFRPKVEIATKVLPQEPSIVPPAPTGVKDALNSYRGTIAEILAKARGTR